MANPFENNEGLYYVLMNEEGQYSLWPDFIPVPSGWDVKNGPAGRSESQEYIQNNWADMRPQSIKTEKGSPVCQK
ncbi:MAG: MbtH family protein [Bacillus sp. (in: firmicutes)]